MAEVGTVTPSLALEAAKTWIGTPYHHQASLKQVGCDCIGLVIGVYRDLYKSDPPKFKLPPYTPFWAEELKRSPMVEIARQYLIELPNLSEAVAGDILMYQMTRGGPTKHCGILSQREPDKFIHAYAGNNVIETPIFKSTGSSHKITHIFRYPPWQQ